MSSGYKAKAAQSLSCPESSLVKSGAQVRGCGRSDVLIQSFNDPTGFSSLREKAAFDMSCDIGELHVQVIGDSYGVSGCDKKATYVLFLAQVTSYSRYRPVLARLSRRSRRNSSIRVRGRIRKRARGLSRVCRTHSRQPSVSSCCLLPAFF
jgi:hypothetical protein